MPEVDHQFELVGDAETLTDEFFDALAAVLLDIAASGASHADNEQICEEGIHS